MTLKSKMTDSPYPEGMTPDRAFDMIRFIPKISQKLFTKTKHCDRLLISEDNGNKIYLDKKNFPSKSFNLLIYMGEIYDRYLMSWNKDQREIASRTLQKYQEVISRNPNRCRIIFPDSGPS